MNSLKKTLDKELLALDRERRELWQRRQQKVTLDEPIQRGWQRNFCLTEEACLRSDADILRAILKRINVIRYHWRRTFSPTKRHQHSQRQRLHQALLTIPRWEWHSPKTAAQWKPYFSREYVLEHGQWTEIFRFRQPRLFELRIQPRMIYELPVCDPIVESRLAEIEAKLADPHLYRRLHRLLGHRNWSDNCSRKRKLARLAKQRVRAAHSGDLEAEKAASWCCLLRRWICRICQFQQHARTNTAAN
jgi:hypothetical protein